MSLGTSLGYGFVAFLAAFVVGEFGRRVLGLTGSARMAFYRAVGIGIGVVIGMYFL